MTNAVNFMPSNGQQRRGEDVMGCGPLGHSVEERVIQIVAEQMGVSPDEVTKDTHLVNDLGAESLDAVELLMEFEEEFDLTIPDEEISKRLIVQRWIEYIEERQ
jgi:acyl carrier protein